MYLAKILEKTSEKEAKVDLRILLDKKSCDIQYLISNKKMEFFQLSFGERLQNTLYFNIAEDDFVFPLCED